LIESWLVQPSVLAADPGAGGIFVQFLPFILIFAIFYFLLILPQQRQRRKLQEMLANLKTGDRVVTSGGLYGKIVGFRNTNVLQLEVAHQVRIDVARSAISALQTPEGEEEGSGAKEAAAKGKK
jgi:preprotein translocase subunit YajC